MPKKRVIRKVKLGPAKKRTAAKAAAKVKKSVTEKWAESKGSTLKRLQQDFAEAKRLGRGKQSTKAYQAAMKRQVTGMKRMEAFMEEESRREWAKRTGSSVAKKVSPASKRRKKDWYGLVTRIDRSGKKHVTTWKNAGDRKAYEQSMKKLKKATGYKTPAVR